MNKKMPEQNETAVIIIRHVSVFVCVRTVTSHSFLIATGRWGTKITDTAGRMVDTNLSGWIYEWLGSEGHVDGCVRYVQTLPAITHPLWRHCCPQTERARRRQAEREMIPNAKRMHNHPHCTQLACFYDVHSQRRKHIYWILGYLSSITDITSTQQSLGCIFTDYGTTAKQHKGLNT